MQKPALVIMAAGLGSRYGGLKQAEPVGPHGELIIDYSIHDAMKAGFGRVICIIKPENREIFEERIGRLHTAAKIEYAYQRMTDLPAGYTIPEGRQKPWGTAHAVMCCAGMLREPFAVINADDYYGPEPFEELYGFLTAPHEENGKLQLCMAGYRLVNTLSDKGTVARGICTVDANGKLTDIDERLKIGWTADGRITDVSREAEVEYDPQTPVSMNCWGCPPELMEELIHCTPGSASVLGLAYDTEHRVRLLMDRETYEAAQFGCHPCLNTGSLRMATADLLNVFLPHTGHTVTVVDLPNE